LHLIRLWHENPGAIFRILYLGGVRIHRGDELITWLAERPDAGILGLLTSLVGFGVVHDRRSGRVSDFDYQLTVLRLGGERGMMPDCFRRRLVPRQPEWARNRVLPKDRIGKKTFQPFCLFILDHGAANRHHERHCSIDFLIRPALCRI
jgi:hypothetical protein